MSWLHRRRMNWVYRGELAFDFAGAMVATGEMERALQWARTGWCYAHHLALVGDVLWWFANEAMCRDNWRDVSVMAQYKRIDRRKGMALVGMLK